MGSYPGLRWLHWSMAGMLVALTVFAVASSMGSWPTAVASLVSGVGLVIGYLMAPRRSRGRWVWLALASVCWVVLGILAKEAAFIAFSLFFLQLHLVGGALGVVLVGLTWLGVVAMLAHHEGAISMGGSLGSLIGAAVAVVMVRSFQTIHQEAERRRIVLEELERTRAHLMAAERRAGQLEERERLAAEIHDTLAQGFTSIQLLLGTATRVLGTQPDAAADLVEQARATASDNLQEARALVGAMAPSLQRRSATEAIERLADDVGRRTGVALDLALAPVDELGEDQQAALVRVAQSALTNVERHAQAQRVRVALDASDGRARLVVADDGRGFEVDQITSDRFGIALMRRRLEHFGGTLQVESTPGAGTTLTLVIPMGDRPGQRTGGVGN